MRRADGLAGRGRLAPSQMPRPSLPAAPPWSSARSTFPRSGPEARPVPAPGGFEVLQQTVQMGAQDRADPCPSSFRLRWALPGAGRAVAPRCVGWMRVQGGVAVPMSVPELGTTRPGRNIAGRSVAGAELPGRARRLVAELPPLPDVCVLPRPVSPPAPATSVPEQASQITSVSAIWLYFHYKNLFSVFCIQVKKPSL